MWTTPSVAAEPSGAATLSTTVVSGPIGERWNPSLRLTAGATARLAVDDWTLAARWAVWRDQAFCDTCAAGLYAPGNGGGARLVDSDDLLLTASRTVSEGDEVTLRARLDLVLPASRDAFACNPFYGAPGVGLVAELPAGLAARASVRAPIYRYDAAPVGRCSAPLDDVAHAPTPWAPGERFAGTNPSLAAGAGLSWGAEPTERLTTSVSAGAQARRGRVADAAVVETLSGPVRVGAGRHPLVWSFPWSIEAAWSVSEPIDLSLTLSNALPAVLADPGAHVRNLPATTAVTLAATGEL